MAERSAAPGTCPKTSPRPDRLQHPPVSRLAPTVFAPRSERSLAPGPPLARVPQGIYLWQVTACAGGIEAAVFEPNLRASRIGMRMSGTPPHCKRATRLTVCHSCLLSRWKHVHKFPDEIEDAVRRTLTDFLRKSARAAYNADLESLISASTLFPPTGQVIRQLHDNEADNQLLRFVTINRIHN